MLSIHRFFKYLVPRKSGAILCSSLLFFTLPASVLAQPSTTSLVEKVLEKLPAVFSSADPKVARSQAIELLSQMEQVVQEATAVSKRSFRPIKGIGDLSFQDARTKHSGIVGEKLLVLSSGGTIGKLDNSIVLVDGSIELGHVTQSVIIATGGVEIAHSDGNIILAAQGISISFDSPLGQHLEPDYYDPSIPEGQQVKEDKKRVSSLLLSGSYLTISHANRTVLSPAGALEISHAHGIVALNVGEVDISHRSGWQELASAALKLNRREPIDLLSGKPLYSLNEGNRYLVGEALREDHIKMETLGQEYCFAGEDSFRIKKDSAVPDCCGTQTRMLSGWSLQTEREGYFIFKKGAQFATVRTEKEPVAAKGIDRICRFEN